MKPRIEKKLSKALVAIFQDTREFQGVWIDNEWYRDTPHGRQENLSGKQERQNRECRVAVNHMPSVGGEADYWGEGTDYFSVYRAYKNALWTTCVYTDELCRLDCLTPRPEEGTPEHAEWEAQKAALLAKAGRDYRRIRPGNRLLPYARRDAAAVRAKAIAETARKARYAELTKGPVTAETRTALWKEFGQFVREVDEALQSHEIRQQATGRADGQAHVTDIQPETQGITV